MPNGKPGDHPLTDILVHGLTVYSPTIDDLIREIVRLADDKEERRLGDMLLFEYSEYAHPDLEKLRGVLQEWRDRLVREAKERGFEA